MHKMLSKDEHLFSVTYLRKINIFTPGHGKTIPSALFVHPTTTKLPSRPIKRLTCHLPFGGLPLGAPTQT